MAANSKTRQRTPRMAAFAVLLTIALAMAGIYPTNFYVDARPSSEDGVRFGPIDIVEGNSTDLEQGKVETKRIPALSQTFSVATSSEECIDDPDFRFETKKKKKKSCKWVGKNKKKQKKRCNKLHINNEPVAKYCRKTCDYKRCHSKTKFTVGAYYYPWWGDDFHRGKRGDLYLRRQLEDPQQFPLLGEYDDTKPETISKHLKWSRKYNIDLWVTSWWGENRKEDNTTKKVILTNPQLRDHKIAIFYETTGRIREKTNWSLENVKPDLEYLCRQYFHHPNYYKHIDYDEYGNIIRERPVLFVYLTRKLEQLQLLETVIDMMRNAANDSGCGEIFIVGDQVFQGPPDATDATKLIPLQILDAVTNYDVYGSLRGGKLGGYVGTREAVTNYFQGEQKRWKAIAESENCIFVPGVSPGFNDRGVRPEKERIPLSRKLNETSAEGSLFRAALQEARKLVDSAMENLLMVNSFNEWHEDTQIEPLVAVDGSKGPTSSTNLPENLTFGLDYEAYKYTYVMILKEETTSWEVSGVPSVLEETDSVLTGIENGLADRNAHVEEIETISDMIGLEID